MNEYEHIPEEEIEKAKGAEVAKLIEGIFDKLPKNVAEILVNSNVVLALAGLKGESEFFIDSTDPESDEKIAKGIDQLNEYFKRVNPNIEVLIDLKSSTVNPDQDRYLIGTVLNLETLERLTQNTKIKQAIPFDRSVYTSVMEWAKAQTENLSGREGAYMEGVMKGYPDQATIDFVDALNTDNIDKLERVSIVSRTLKRSRGC